ncbi:MULTISPECIES: recombinase family protein [Microbacterium]|uniref:recombinase family protein n=1 Tax=Microbacterium TaxID=33882 RepID=UPI002E11CE0D
MGTTTALIYLRISANRTSEHASIGQQRADCVELAHELGYARMIEFADEAVSAYQDRARPAYQELLRQLEESATTTVIVWHLDRLYRKPRELEQLLDLLDANPIRVESVQGGSFDLNRHEGRLFARQLVAFAHYESAHKGARVARAQQQRAKRGLLHGGRHYGYRRDGSLDTHEGRVIRRIVDDYLIGLTPVVIARDLTRAGVRTPIGGDRWGATTIRSILGSDRLHRRRLTAEREPQTPGRWDAIITADEAALVEAQLLLPGIAASRSSRSLLGGIVCCPRCTGRLVSGVNRLGRREYSCRTATVRCGGPTLDAKFLDAKVEAEVFNLLNRERIGHLPCAHQILRSVREARRRLVLLAEDFGAGELDHAEYLERRVPQTTVLCEGFRALSAHRRARVLSLAGPDLQERWGASLSFRRAVVCAFYPDCVYGGTCPPHETARGISPLDGYAAT